MSFSIKNKLSFIDSFQFVSPSLNSLVKNLAKDYFKYLSQESDNNVSDLVKQKRLYPYEYMSDFEKFKEELPSKEKFYSSLTGENKHVLKVWNKFEMKTDERYHDLYLKCEVLLLADAFEKFKNNSLDGLRPYHYLSASVLSWDAMFNMAKVKLELIPDPDMYIFFQKGTRGGVSYISDRIKNQELESNHNIYLDALKLYGHAMSTFLPTSGFKWIDPKEFELNKYTSNSSKGCVLEVDLEYPKELRELHNNYPLAPYKIEIKREMLWDYQLKIAILYNIPIGNVKKLVPNFCDKEKYMIHYEYFMNICNFTQD